MVVCGSFVWCLFFCVVGDLHFASSLLQLWLLFVWFVCVLGGWVGVVGGVGGWMVGWGDSGCMISI